MNVLIDLSRLSRYVRSYGDRENDLDSVSKCGLLLIIDHTKITSFLDLRGKFSAIHREYSPNPRKFYAFCTSVTVSFCYTWIDREFAHMVHSYSRTRQRQLVSSQVVGCTLVTPIPGR